MRLAGVVQRDNVGNASAGPRWIRRGYCQCGHHHPTATTHQPPPLGPLRPKAIRAVAASVRVSGQYDRKRRGKRIRMQYIPADEQEPMIMPGNLNLLANAAAEIQEEDEPVQCATSPCKKVRDCPPSDLARFDDQRVEDLGPCTPSPIRDAAPIGPFH